MFKTPRKMLFTWYVVVKVKKMICFLFLLDNTPGKERVIMQLSPYQMLIPSARAIIQPTMGDKSSTLEGKLLETDALRYFICM